MFASAVAAAIFFSLFCLHHFPLLFIFLGLLLFTMLALDHFFTSFPLIFLALARFLFVWENGAMLLDSPLFVHIHTHKIYFCDSFLFFIRAACSLSLFLRTIQIEKHFFMILNDYTSVVQLDCRAERAILIFFLHSILARSVFVWMFSLSSLYCTVPHV